jgi:hypothetical protein
MHDTKRYVKTQVLVTASNAIDKNLFTATQIFREHLERKYLDSVHHPAIPMQRALAHNCMFVQKGAVLQWRNRSLCLEYLSVHDCSADIDWGGQKRRGRGFQSPGTHLIVAVQKHDVLTVCLAHTRIPRAINSSVDWKRDEAYARVGE